MECLDAITARLDEFLRVAAFDDQSQNGLQVSGRQRVRRVAGLVDASAEGFAAALELGADMVVVHHGLLWNSPVRLTGPFFDRVKLLIENGVSLYAAHLPLDAHPEVGNNARLTEIVGARLDSWYAEWGGANIGCIGTFQRPLPLAGIIEILDENLHTETRVYDFGPSEIGTVGIVSGSACDALSATKARGADLFITGEPRLAAYHEAHELEINVAFAGHYATERVGIEALVRRLPAMCDVEAIFIDVPCDI